MNVFVSPPFCGSEMPAKLIHVQIESYFVLNQERPLLVIVNPCVRQALLLRITLSNLVFTRQALLYDLDELRLWKLLPNTPMNEISEELAILCQR